jgi:glycerol-3-phosphate dehydrogenase (NAD(P)+)
MTQSKRIAVLGGGSFGTVIANIAAENGYPVHLWMRNEEAADTIRQTGVNEKYLPGLKLHENLQVFTELKEAVEEAELIFFAVPSKSFRSVVERVALFISKDHMLVSTTKGIEPGTLNLMSDILRSELPNNTLGVMGGPNLAKEIAKHEITATVIATQSSKLRQIVQETLGCVYFRVYASADIYGVELGGALKNIYAIMAGISAAKQLGENTMAMLLTRSLAEMGRFAETQGANPMTFLGLAGVGDLIATCSSPLSRNYRVGHAFGSGKTLDAAVASLGEVAEGVNTLTQVKRYADEQDIYMPLVQGLHKVLFEGAQVEHVVSSLMLAERNSDVEYTLPKDEI